MSQSAAPDSTSPGAPKGAVDRAAPNLVASTDVEAMNAQSRGTLAERMGIEFIELGAQRTVGRMPVAGNTQPYGLLHGGASAVLAETIGSTASALHAGPGRIALGLELSCTHHRAKREGVVTGVATPVALTRNVASYDIRITDEDGKPVCTARLTCLLRDAG
jgi:uncharacterized protein (TIGR00369 family)